MEYVRRGSTVALPLPEGEVVPGVFACRSGATDPLRTVVRGFGGVAEGDFVGASLSATDAKALDDVTGALSSSARWEQWCGASPVVVSFEGCAALTPLEEALDAELGVLEAVCHAPRMLLRYDEERVAVSRARRVSPRTVSDLISRPVDWEHRTLRGIRPARVLALTTEDEVDLYENRMVARLIDRLLVALTLRVDQLREILALLAEGHDFTDETCGSHWRVRRMSIAWARVQGSDELRAEIEQTHRRVCGLLRKVRALTASPLYRDVPRAARVEDSLRVTNVLANDDRYRRLATLWRRLVEARRESSDARGNGVARREAAERFDSFAFMLLAQALSNLGYSLVSEERQSTRLRSARGELRVSRQPDGSVILESGARHLVVVALPVAATAGDLSPLWTALRISGHRDALYLLCGRPGVLRVAGVCDGDTRRGLSGWDSPRALLVSPWALDSVERVARVVGAWDASGRLESYPPSVATKMTSIGEWTTRPSWVDVSTSGLSITRPMTQAERSAAIDRLDHAAPPKERARAQLERERDQALRQLLEKTAELPWLTRCPVCEREARVSVEGRGMHLEQLADRTFWCRCLDCGASWGLRRCGRCAGRFAVLDDGVSVRCPDEVVDLDRVHGRDQWHPARSKDGARDYRCTKCEPLSAR